MTFREYVGTKYSITIVSKIFGSRHVFLPSVIDKICAIEIFIKIKCINLDDHTDMDKNIPSKFSLK